MEANEWAFCSLWAKRKRGTGCARALLNEKLAGDYFFNRATVEGCDVPVHKVAGIFWQAGMDCHLYFRSSPPRGLRKVDTMYVLRSSGGTAPAGDVVVCRRADVPVWIDVFVRSFSVPGWKDEVTKIITKNFDKLELLLAYHKDKPAGCAALYTKNKATGLYCLGTLPRFRSKGIATLILQNAKMLAGSDFLFLQTLGSESLLGLYKRSGFCVVYKKSICVASR